MIRKQFKTNIFLYGGHSESKGCFDPPTPKKKNYTKSRWRVTDPPVLPLKLKKSASCYGQLVPVGHKSMMKFYNPAKCEVGYRYGFISPSFECW